VIAQPPQECGTFDLGCQAGQAISSTFQALVAEVARGAADLVVTTSTWWAETDSVNPADSAVLAAQDVTAPLVATILVGSVLVQAIRMILSRKGEPLIMVATGLFRFAVVSALGLTVLQAALRAGDALAQELLNGAANNFALLMRDALTTSTAGTFVILLVAVVAAVLSLVQWVLMAIRQAGLLVLAAMLPLAASGSLTRSTRGWLDRLIVWLIAIVAYKPAAAFIYYIGFSYLSTTSSNAPGDISTLITGLMVLVLAVIAMPVMLKFFSWTGTQIGGASGGGSGFLGAVGAATMARSYGQSPAVRRAAAMEATGPGSAPTSASPQPAGAAAVAGRAGAAGMAVAAGGAMARRAAERMTGAPPQNGSPS
jgi:type IV secretion system protein TrbL